MLVAMKETIASETSIQKKNILYGGDTYHMLVVYIMLYSIERCLKRNE